MFRFLGRFGIQKNIVTVVVESASATDNANESLTSGSVILSCAGLDTKGVTTLKHIKVIEDADGGSLYKPALRCTFFTAPQSVTINTALTTADIDELAGVADTDGSSAFVEIGDVAVESKNFDLPIELNNDSRALYVVVQRKSSGSYNKMKIQFTFEQ